MLIQCIVFSFTGIPQLPFLISNTETPVVDLQSPFQNGTLEGPIPVNHPDGFRFGSSIQTNFSVSQRDLLKLREFSSLF